tara:strand:+ start:14909 stop:15250 length:342 start_codon:yes stop_codon:yes gene_type:complete
LISIEVIRKSKEFLEIISNGNKFTRPGIIIYYIRPNGLDKLRVGISVKKQVGNSVVRNKLRRQIKSLLRDVPARFNEVSMVLVVMKNNQGLDYPYIKNILDEFDDLISRVSEQ